MRILFCGDAFPAARPRLARRVRQNEDELVVSSRDDIGAALEGVDVVIRNLDTPTCKFASWHNPSIGYSTKDSPRHFSGCVLTSTFPITKGADFSGRKMKS